MDFHMARPLKDSGRFTIVKESRASSAALVYDARDTEVDRPTGAHDASEGDSYSRPVLTGWMGLAFELPARTVSTV